MSKLDVFVTLLCLAAPLAAQEYRGTISGSVTDSQGAAIPQAKIVATQTGTGTKTTTVSGSTGEYTLPFLSLGKYDISAEATGFKKVVRSGIAVSAGEHPVIDLHMEVGNVTESVVVSADSPILVTANSTLGQVITTAAVEDVPVNGRTPMMLDNMAMGVISTF